ncbi:expressed unknown protein [Seminavis robusta]|uniref:Uncharacterized protein n=1 Tax=Seminavis robusta TaxID=568900 RepID=A0A9N8EFK0_9STRA|nr:expressed unknown protein [Seminavis robusta]|eukprot:Sro871_g213780.1 n/a (463) ;mRNA; f:9725-11113
MDTAKKLMQDLRHAGHADVKNQKIEALLVLFQEQPQLISEKFYYQSNYMTALHAFILKEASLGTIKRLCSLAPNLPQLLGTRSEEIKDRRRGECPLNAACSAAPREDLIVFLAEKHPKTLTRKGFNGESAIESVMKSGDISQETRRKLLKLSPTTGFDMILNMVLRDTLFPTDFVDLIIDRKKTWSVEIESHLCADKARIVCTKLIPRLRVLDLHTDWESNQTFLDVTNGIQKANKVVEIRHFTLASLRGMGEDEQQETIQAFQAALEGNTKLTSVSLQFALDSSLEVKIAWCTAILSSLSTMAALRNFSIESRSSIYAWRETKPDFLEGSTDGCLKLVEKHLNLTTLSPWEGNDRRIRYYSNLNRYGRSKARNATASQMAAILTSFELFGRFSYMVCCEDDEALSIVYGLLRETPGSWSRGEILPPSLSDWSPNRKKRRKLGLCESMALVSYFTKHNEPPY